MTFPTLGPMPAAYRMRTLDEQTVRASPQRMFELARDVERWPKHLPHYRFVRFREGDAEHGVVEMSANRPFGLVDWPTWWVSHMEIQRHGGVPTVRFKHIEGVTAGMDVEWAFRPVTDGVHVTVLHLWNGPAWPLIRDVAAQMVIGPVFVHGIASRTLAGLARVAEQGQTSP